MTRIERCEHLKKFIEIRDDGLPYWLVTRNSQAIEGTVAGGLTSSGYRRVAVKVGKVNKEVMVHQLSFYIHAGYIPKIIDHINREPDDNRFCNLREVTMQQNLMNRKFSKGSSEFKGVSFDKSKMKFKAQINIKGKRTHLGYFKCEIEAAMAYDKAALKEFGEYAYLNFSV